MTTVLKFLSYLVIRSPSTLSETYHSTSDTGSQVFLLIGIHSNKRDETQSRPFDRGESQFPYSFLVSVILFDIAGRGSAKHDYDALMHPGHDGGGEALALLGLEIEPMLVNVTILLGMIIFESYVFLKADAGLRRQIEEYGWSGLVEALREVNDVTTFTVFTEDTVALVSTVFTLTGIGLTEPTGNELFDADAALLTGVLFMGLAIALTWENKCLLIGESAPMDEEQALRDIVKDDPRVARIDHFRASYVGPEKLLAALDMSFDPELGIEGLNNHITKIEDEFKATDDRVYFVYIKPEL